MLKTLLRTLNLNSYNKAPKKPTKNAQRGWVEWQRDASDLIQGNSGGDTTESNGTRYFTKWN